MAEWNGPYIRPEWRQLATLRTQTPPLSLREAAQALGVSYQTVYQWTKKALYQGYEAFVCGKVFEQLPPEVRASKAKLEERYVDHAIDMQDRLLTILETTSDARLQAQIAQDWLNRTPGGAIEKDQRSGNIFVIPENVIQTMLKRAAEAGLPAAGDVTTSVQKALEGEVVS